MIPHILTEDLVVITNPGKPLSQPSVNASGVYLNQRIVTHFRNRYRDWIIYFKPRIIIWVDIPSILLLQLFECFWYILQCILNIITTIKPVLVKNMLLYIYMHSYSYSKTCDQIFKYLIIFRRVFVFRNGYFSLKITRIIFKQVIFIW